MSQKDLSPGATFFKELKAFAESHPGKSDFLLKLHEFLTAERKALRAVDDKSVYESFRVLRGKAQPYEFKSLAPNVEGDSCLQLFEDSEAYDMVLDEMVAKSTLGTVLKKYFPKLGGFKTYTMREELFEQLSTDASELNIYLDTLPPHNSESSDSDTNSSADLTSGSDLSGGTVLRDSLRVVPVQLIDEDSDSGVSASDSSDSDKDDSAFEKDTDNRVSVKNAASLLKAASPGAEKELTGLFQELLKLKQRNEALEAQAKLAEEEAQRANEKAAALEGEIEQIDKINGELIGAVSEFSLKAQLAEIEARELKDKLNTERGDLSPTREVREPASLKGVPKINMKQLRTSAPELSPRPERASKSRRPSSIRVPRRLSRHSSANKLPSSGETSPRGTKTRSNSSRTGSPQRSRGSSVRLYRRGKSPRRKTINGLFKQSSSPPKEPVSALDVLSKGSSMELARRASEDRLSSSGGVIPSLSGSMKKPLRAGMSAPNNSPMIPRKSRPATYSGGELSLQSHDDEQYTTPPESPTLHNKALTPPNSPEDVVLEVGAAGSPRADMPVYARKTSKLKRMAVNYGAGDARRTLLIENEGRSRTNSVEAIAPHVVAPGQGSPRAAEEAHGSPRCESEKKSEELQLFY